MTELEKIKYAKIYIDRLAEGIDPTSGEVLSDDTILNNINLSRCFYYVSGILRQVIENDGIFGKKRQVKQKLIPFNLTEESCSKIEITEAPVMIKYFTERINNLVDDSVMQKLKVTELTNWFVKEGLLREDVVNDKKRKKPTKAGEKIGIISEVREGHYRSYLAILYNESAQRYLVSSLKQIVNISNDEEIFQNAS